MPGTPSSSRPGKFFSVSVFFSTQSLRLLSSPPGISLTGKSQCLPLRLWGHTPRAQTPTSPPAGSSAPDKWTRQGPSGKRGLLKLDHLQSVSQRDCGQSVGSIWVKFREQGITSSTVTEGLVSAPRGRGQGQVNAQPPSPVSALGALPTSQAPEPRGKALSLLASRRSEEGWRKGCRSHRRGQFTLPTSVPSPAEQAVNPLPSG